MINVTISMDETLHRTTRIRAAEAGLSMSKYLAKAADHFNESANANAEGNLRNIQLEAITKFLDGPKWSVLENGRMPTAEERNARG